MADLPRDGFLSAAHHTSKDQRLPHQDAAWAYAWEQLDQEQRQKFYEMFRADPALKEPIGFTPDSPLSYRITPHFTYGELCLQEPERRFIRQHQCRTAVELCRFLESLRTHFGGKPVKITSGHRPRAINEQVGGASNSEHIFSVPGEGAVDVCVMGVDTAVVQKWVGENWPYSVGYGARKGFVHIGRRADGQRRRWDY